MGKLTTSRRDFLKAGTALAIPAFIPASVLGMDGTPPANEKLNVAHIGTGGIARGDARNVAKSDLANVVALCDVALGSDHTATVEEMYPDVPRYTDFRKLFDEMADQIDVCIISTPDHAHFPIAMLAMSLGKHIYLQKPLAHTFEECELLMAAEKRYKVACQMGNQGHSGPNYFQFKAWAEAGIIKDVTKVVACMNSGRRWHKWGEITGYPTGETMPESLDWDTWLGTMEHHEYSELLHPGNWRGWFDFGNGAFGDWGPHILDTVHRFLDLGLPTKITAVKRDTPNEWIFPLASTIRFDFPARGDMPPCEVTWYDGADNRPPEADTPEGKDLETCGKIIYGGDIAFQGAHHGSPLRVVPEEKAAEMADELPEYGEGSEHHLNLLLSAKGEEKPRSSFDITGPLTQVFSLGCIAQRLGGELEFDRETKRFTNNERANALLSMAPRKGWEEFYRL